MREIDDQILEPSNPDETMDFQLIIEIPRLVNVNGEALDGATLSLGGSVEEPGDFTTYAVLTLVVTCLVTAVTTGMVALFWARANKRDYYDAAIGIVSPSRGRQQDIHPVVVSPVYPNHAASPPKKKQPPVVQQVQPSMQKKASASIFQMSSDEVTSPRDRPTSSSDGDNESEDAQELPTM
jgi:hypothetical protein